MPPLFELARPKALDEIVGQDQAIATVRRFANRGQQGEFSEGIVGRVFWITGPSGTGKTTLARIIARMVSLPYAIEELDAADLSVERIREIERSCRLKPMGCLAHAYVVNEAHSLRGPILARLNTTLEAPQVQCNSTWCFTTTLDGQQKLFSEDEIERVPFGSRTVPVRLRTNIVAFAERVRTVAQANNLDGRPLADYIDLLKKHNGNMREAFQIVDSGEFS